MKYTKFVDILVCQTCRHANALFEKPVILKEYRCNKCHESIYIIGCRLCPEHGIEYNVMNKNYSTGWTITH